VSEPSQPCSQPGCGRTYPHEHCVVCRRAFMAGTAPPPEICGQLHCRARHLWGPRDWAGRARLARARAAAGLDLDDLDREALARTEGSPPA
jgi:hypothetical protein